MKDEHFVDKHSIMRRIWGNSDTILLIFAGASAEFALNKAVDWLYFTGRLPADPLGRLFSTVSYARKIVFSEKGHAYRAIDAIAAIHAAVETRRGAGIPGEAYRDVLFMLIDYSIRAYEALQRKLNHSEKEEVFDVFWRVGNRMGLTGLPQSYEAWICMREEHMAHNLHYSPYTRDLFRRYRNQLGAGRYLLLRESQRLVVPTRIAGLLGLRRMSLLGPVIGMYKAGRTIRMDKLLKMMILPPAYKEQILDLDIAPG